MLRESLDSVLKVESTAHLDAEHYERLDEKMGSGNGFRDRPLTVRRDSIMLKQHKHKNGDGSRL